MYTHVGFFLGPRLQLGQMELQDGNHAAALSQLQRAVSYIQLLQASPNGVAKRWPEVKYLEEAEVMVAECLHKLQQRDQAAETYAKVIERLRQAQPGKPTVLATALHSSAALAAEQRDMALARRYMRESAELSLTLPGVTADLIADRLKALLQVAAVDPGADGARELVNQALEAARRSDLVRGLPASHLELLNAALAFHMKTGDLQSARQTLEASQPVDAAAAAAASGLSLALVLRQLELAARLGDEDPFHDGWEAIRHQATSLPAAQRDVFAEHARAMAWESIDAAIAELGQEGDRAFRAREVTELSASLLVPLLEPENPRSRFVRLQEGFWQLMTIDTPSARLSFENLLQQDTGTAEDAWLRAFATLMLGWVHALQRHDDVAIALGKDALNAFRSQQAAGTVADCSRACVDIARLALTGEGMAYRMLTDWLIRAGRLSEAQQLLLVLREDELAESMRWGSALPSSDSRAALTGLELDRFRGFYRLREQQAALAHERLQLQAQQAAGRLDGAGRARLQQISRLEAEELKPAVSRFLQGLDSAMAVNADTVVVQNSASVRAEATQIQRDIDKWAREAPLARAVGVQYLVGRENLSILVTVPGLSPIARQLPIPRAELYNAVYTAQTLMRTPLSAPNLLRPALQRLHALLLAPIENDLRRMGTHTLLLSLDDRLRQLPFAALIGTDGRHVIEDYAIALYNEATSGMPTPGRSRDWRVAAMGTSKAVGGLPALMAVPAELAEVVRVSRSGGQTFLDGQFTRATLDRALTQRSTAPFNVLHLASHFVLRPGDAGASTLFLGDGTSISLAEISRRQFDFRGFELVVYSACETGVAGGRTANGMEMESLSALTRRQGAATVLGTLWKVSDTSVARAMATFYDQSARGGDSLADTLRQTQLAMLRGERGTSASHRHPFHWAPFVLMGNWR
ncbi:CHAT domain-containing protein [Roseateles sp. LYH14W]|uniref:CHAT domain-containing protein n=1 Tax=Pelomonas parva TaxID=3299032 RepID=A0ABW7FAC3_9BURK